MKERVTYFDFLRGIAILMVLGIHSYLVVPFDSLSNALRINLREMINFAVPLFLAISGYFIGQKSIKSKEQYFSFLKKQVPRVYIPMLIWSIPIVVIWIINGKSFLTAIALGMIGVAFAPYYFIILIIQFYLLHPLIVKAVESKWGGKILIIINVFSFVLFNYIGIRYNLPFVFLVGPFVYWVTFYYLGVYFSSHNRFYSLKWPLILIVLGAISQLASCYYMMSPSLSFKENVFAGWLYSVSAWTYELGAVLLLFSNKAENVYNKHANVLRFIRSVGIYAFGIYLIHVHVRMLVEEYTAINIWIEKWIVISLATIAIVWILSSILPPRAQKNLGLK